MDSMQEFSRLMQAFSIPRPNGSRAERATSTFIREWLEQRQIPYRIHRFTVNPYHFECLGLWFILSRTLLAVIVWLGRGWAPALAAGVILAVELLDGVKRIPLITWPGRRQVENILIEFSPQQAEEEVVISAHYDSKTELLDHRQRMFFLKNIYTGIFLTAGAGLLAGAGNELQRRGLVAGDILSGLALALCLPLLILAYGYGLNLALGRLVQPSQGAVDNGAACAILLVLAGRLRHSELPPHTRITLALFTGEEVDRQGSRAYVRSRDWNLPAEALNLEVMGQDGEYVLWEREGSVFGLKPCSREVNARVSAAVSAVTGAAPVPGGPITSDGASFLAAGIPTAVLGTYDRRLKDTGFHRPADHLKRVRLERLQEGVDILIQYMEKKHG